MAHHPFYYSGRYHDFLYLNMLLITAVFRYEEFSIKNLTQRINTTFAMSAWLVSQENKLNLGKLLSSFKRKAFFKRKIQHLKRVNGRTHSKTER